MRRGSERLISRHELDDVCGLLELRGVDSQSSHAVQRYLLRRALGQRLAHAPLKAKVSVLVLPSFAVARCHFLREARANEWRGVREL